MAKVIKYAVSLVDSEGVEWVAGQFTQNQIQTWRNRYIAQGIFLSVREVA